MKEYVVSFKTSEQISPEDWRVVRPAMKINENTTMKEISDFFRKWEKGGQLEVIIRELSNQQP